MSEILQRAEIVRCATCGMEFLATSDDSRGPNGADFCMPHRRQGTGKYGYGGIDNRGTVDELTKLRELTEHQLAVKVFGDTAHDGDTCPWCKQARELMETP